MRPDSEWLAPLQTDLHTCRCGDLWRSRQDRRSRGPRIQRSADSLYRSPNSNPHSLSSRPDLYCVELSKVLNVHLHAVRRMQSEYEYCRKPVVSPALPRLLAKPLTLPNADTQSSKDKSPMSIFCPRQEWAECPLLQPPTMY